MATAAPTCCSCPDRGAAIDERTSDEPDDSDDDRGERPAGGDREALAELLGRSLPRLRRLLALSAGLRRDQLEAVVQSVQHAAISQFASYRHDDPQSFFRWLARLALDRAPRRGPYAISNEPASPERIDRALAELRDDEGHAIALSRVHGLPLEDVAAAMRRPRAAVALLLSRALRRLRRRLAAEGEAPEPP